MHVSDVGRPKRFRLLASVLPVARKDNFFTASRRDVQLFAIIAHVHCRKLKNVPSLPTFPLAPSRMFQEVVPHAPNILNDGFSNPSFDNQRWAGTETVLYQFMSDQDGYTPLNGVLLVRGKVYGTTSNGGLHNGRVAHPLQRFQ